MNRLRAIDAAIVEVFQEAYLWLWDRTGVYVATILFSMIAAEHALNYRNESVIGFACLGLMGLSAGFRYHQQGSSLKRFNAMQRSWREFPLRLIVLFLMEPPFMVVDFVHHGALSGLSDICFYGWNFLACVQVRDRNPTDFFTFHKFAGAMQ